LPEGGRVLDLGGGTGGLAAVVADRFPTANVEIWDTDPAMLDVAMERCRSFGNRVSGVCRSFADGLPRCDAVVACIALHHVMDLEAKRAIYANIHRALRKGGIFANADCTMSASAVIRGACFAIWTQFMRDNGLSDAEVRRNYESWAREDYYPPIETELGLLKDAGFAEPDCFWRSAPFAVFGGVR
jgi:tRNA (cmo5U34)-methyltransferase